jgi:hypothetical protein
MPATGSGCIPVVTEVYRFAPARAPSGAALHLVTNRKGSRMLNNPNDAFAKLNTALSRLTADLHTMRQKRDEAAEADRPAIAARCAKLGALTGIVWRAEQAALAEAEAQADAA